MSPKEVKYSAFHMAAAKAELVKGMLVLYPQAQILPRVVLLEDQEISSWCILSLYTTEMCSGVPI